MCHPLGKRDTLWVGILFIVNQSRYIVTVHLYKLRFCYLPGEIAIKAKICMISFSSHYFVIQQGLVLIRLLHCRKFSANSIALDISLRIFCHAIHITMNTTHM